MKRIVLFLFALTSLSLQAQNFSVEALDTTLYGSPTESTFYGDIDLFNDLGSTFSMTWERIEEDIPVGWTTSNCDPHTCHPEGVTTASFMLPLLPSMLNTHFYPHGVAGTGYMKVKLWMSTNPADSVILTYYGVAGAVGINELEASDVQVFPSPAQNSLNIMLPHPGETIRMDIFNLSGQRAESFTITDGNLNSFDVSKLEAGMYIIHLDLAGQGRITKKFVKS